jgi:putative effector of murein hydrolase
VLVALVLTGTGTSYGTYFAGAQFVHLLLGPATVAIAVPLFRNWVIVRRNLLPMLAALAAGPWLPSPPLSPSRPRSACRARC